MYKFIYLFCNDVNEKTPAQPKETKNPKTNDSILIYISILFASLFILTNIYRYNN